MSGISRSRRVLTMRIEVGVPCPLPDDPLLAEVAVAVRDTDDWGSIVDSNWRRVYSSDDEKSDQRSRRAIGSNQPMISSTPNPAASIFGIALSIMSHDIHRSGLTSSTASSGIPDASTKCC